MLAKAGKRVQILKKFQICEDVELFFITHTPVFLLSLPKTFTIY